MKNLPGTLSSLCAFTLAIACAMAQQKEMPEYGIYGSSSTGLCLASPSTIEDGCDVSGPYQCTVFLEVTSEEAPAYKMKVNSSQCAMPLRRW